MQMPNRKNLARLFAEIDKLIQGKARKRQKTYNFQNKEEIQGKRIHTHLIARLIEFKLQKLKLCATWLRTHTWTKGTDWNPEIDLYRKGQLIFNKDAEVTQESTVFSTNCAGTHGYPNILIPTLHHMRW